MPIQASQPENKDPTPGKSVSPLKFLTHRKISSKDRAFMTEQLSLLLETGTSLHRSLEAIQNQAENPAMRELLSEIHQKVTEGKPFSRTLADYPEVFDGTYVNLVSAGEQGGFMHTALSQLLEMQEKREEIRTSIISAFSYPAFLILFSIGVVVFVLVSVFPRFEDLFISIRDDLPGSTVVLLGLSQLLRNYSQVLLLGLLGLVILFRMWAASPSGKRLVDRMLLQLPLVKDIMIQVYLVNTLRALSLSLGNGVSILNAMHSCREIVSNAVFQRFFSDVEDCVEQGEGIAVGFERSSFIPDITKQMVRTGEESGQLPQVMGRIADFYERELSRKLLLLSKLVEPVMLLVMGVLVGYIVSALILPVFKLSGAVG